MKKSGLALYNMLFFILAYAHIISNSAFAATPAVDLNKEKIQVILALPFQEDIEIDPNVWYTEAFVDYIAQQLPADQYKVTGYFVTFENLPKFLDDMLALHAKQPNMRVLNFCDGGEWDGFPGITVVKKWEEHAINGLVSMSGADSQFIFHSDDKMRMHSHITQAKLPSLPQMLVPVHSQNKPEFRGLLLKAGLDQKWPLFCKLNIGAGALGVGPESICYNLIQLQVQLNKLNDRFQTSDLLVQPYLPGPEYTILVLRDQVYAGVRRDFNNPENMMAEDFLHDAKIVKDEVTYYPAPEEVQKLALNAIKAIPGKHHYTRVDLRADGKGNVYVIDINDRPSFGNPSTVRTMLEYHNKTEGQFLVDILKTCSQ